MSSSARKSGAGLVVAALALTAIAVTSDIVSAARIVYVVVAGLLALIGILGARGHANKALRSCIHVLWGYALVVALVAVWSSATDIHVAVQLLTFRIGPVLAAITIVIALVATLVQLSTVVDVNDDRHDERQDPPS